MRRTVPPSAEIEEQIDRLLAVGVGETPREALSELASGENPPAAHNTRSRATRSERAATPVA